MPMPTPEASFTAHIEKHTADGIPVWTFQKPDASSSPLVIVLHGLNSRKERHLELCLMLAEAGLTACIMDLRAHGERRDDDSATLLGDRTTPAFADAFARVVLGTAEDVSQVAAYFGAKQYGLVGHSLGGYTTLQTALRDPNIAALAVISGTIDVSGPVPSGMTLPDIAAEASALAPRPLLLLHGTDDNAVPIAGARKFHATFQTAYGPNANRLRLIEYPGIGHDLLPEMRTAVVEWMAEWLVDSS